MALLRIITNSFLCQSLIVITGLLLFIPITEVPLFDWDEINFAEAAREMVVTKNYLRVQIDYMPFWEKPPLFFWMQALSMHLFGINEFAARFPNAICGLLTILVIFNIGKSLKGIEFGLLWALTYAGCFLPQVYFMTGIIDPVYNLFVFISLYQLFLAFIKQRNWMHFVLSGAFLGLAVLTKGPVAVLLFALCLVFYDLLYNDRYFFKSFYKDHVIIKGLMWLCLSFTLICSVYYVTEYIQNGSWFFENFFNYHLRLLQTEDAGHGQPFYYHFLVLLIGCLPASVLLLGSVFKIPFQETDDNLQFRGLMIILLVVVLIVFSIVKTKIIHYSSLCYFPITFLSTYYLHSVMTHQLKWSRYLPVLLLITGFGFSCLLAAIPLGMMNLDIIVPYIKDPFVLGNLEAKASWHMVHFIPSFLYFASIIGAVICWRQHALKLGYVILFVGTLVGSNIAVRTIVPNIEKYTQGAVVEFCKGLVDKDCYVEVLDYKSYAHLFYAKKEFPLNVKARDKKWLLFGEIDKPAYFICKNIHAQKYMDMPQLTLLDEKNGFCFFYRPPLN